MYWVCTCIFTGVFLSIGWHLGVVVYNRLEMIVKNTAYVVQRRKRRYKRTTNYYTESYYPNRSRGR